MVVPCFVRRKRVRTSCCALYASVLIEVNKCFDYSEKSQYHHHNLPNPVVGSSTKSKIGLVSSSDANDKRFFSPPDIVFPFTVSPIRVLQQSNKPTLASVDFTNAFFS